VQDLIRRDGAKIWSQIEHDKASLFVCGDAKHMAADVAVNCVLPHTVSLARTHRKQEMKYLQGFHSRVCRETLTTLPTCVRRRRCTLL
jgi:sulfite reductase alpha subunit-like flavoprotein